VFFLASFIISFLLEDSSLASLLAKNSLVLLDLRMSRFSLYYRRIILLDIEVCFGIFLLGSASMVSDERSAVIQIVFPLQTGCNTSATFNIFSLSLFLKSLIIMCLGMNFFGLTLWFTQFFKSVCLHLLTNLGIFSHIFLAHFQSLPLSPLPHLIFFLFLPKTWLI